MGEGDSGYQFGSGIGEDEVARLEIQGRALAPATRMILAEAGIRPGMRVLDLGCGAGDATFVAADLVGPGGSVVGLDHSSEALAHARLRAGRRGLAQVEFIEADEGRAQPEVAHDQRETRGSPAERGADGVRRAQQGQHELREQARPAVEDRPTGQQHPWGAHRADPVRAPGSRWSRCAGCPCLRRPGCLRW